MRMLPPPRARHGLAALILGAVALAAGAPPAPADAQDVQGAQGLEDAACQAFAGAAACGTVTVVDAGQCIVKIRPHPLPPLDPTIAGCLIDEIGTRQLFLKNAWDADTAVLEQAGGAGGAAAKTRVRIAGLGVAQILAAYDDNGAPVWEARDEATFEHAGGAAETRAALARLSTELCGPGSGAEAAAGGGDEGAGAGAIPRAIGVEEAYRLSAAGRIRLIDVRHQSEWRETGIAATAVPITMNQRREDFIQRLRAEAAAAGATPLALICARGESSAYLQGALRAYGLDGIIDVKGGMLGADGAPGWIPAGLPVKAWEGE